MENINEEEIKTSAIMKRYFKPGYQDLFNKIQTINTPLKNDILQALLDGQWHSESEMIKLAKKQERTYVGAVTVGSMINSMNCTISSSYLERKHFDGENWYKISDNYVGLSRAACKKYRYGM